MVKSGISTVDQVFERYNIVRMTPFATDNSIFTINCKDCDLDNLQEDLSKLSDELKYVEKSFIYPVHTCANPLSLNDAYPNNTLYDKIEAKCAWTFSTGSSSIVGLIDVTGNGLNNNDIDSKVQNTYNYTSTTFHKHGNYMGGLIAASTNNSNGVASVGYNADVNLYNIGLSEVFVSGAQAVNAVNQAVTNNVDVINMSFTWNNSGSLHTAIDNAISNNVVVVTSAGNNSYNNGCGHPDVICVTSVDSNDEHAPTNNQSSSAVDLSAPDRGYWSLAPNNGVQQMFRGTSQSAALVSGTVALMKDIHPGLTPLQARTFLTETTDDISNIGSNGTTYAGLIGSGRLNVYRAVQQAEIYVSQISGDNNLCPNESEYYSVPSFEGASYNWTVTNGSIQNGQGTNQIWFKASSGFSWGQVKCEITVGNASQLKVKTIGLDFGCSGGGYFMSTYPNPAVAPQDLVVSMSSDITEEAESLSVTPTTYSLYNPYGEQLSSKTSKESVIFSTNGLKEGIYTIIGTNQETSVTSRVVIK